MAQFYNPDPIERNTELNVKVQICNKIDCPIYGCFFDPMLYGPLREVYNKRLSENPSKMYEIVVETSGRIRTNCLSCQYFEKVDMYGMMISAEAKMLLER